MASRKRQPEGIALLSMYDDNEEEDDEDMEDAGEEHRRGREREERKQHGDASMVDADVDSGNDKNGTSGVDGDSSARNEGQFRHSASEQKLSEVKGSPGQVAATEMSRRGGRDACGL